MPRRHLAVSLLPVICAGMALGQESSAPPGTPPGEGTTEAPTAVVKPVRKVLKALGEEARRYGTDSLALVAAPLLWDENDWKKAGGVTLLLGGLLLADKKLDHEAQIQRSHFTDRVSSATTSLGGGNGVKISVGLLAAGLVFKSDNTRDMGREAIEAGVLTSLLNNLVLKRAFGRERPGTSNGRTDFDAGSGNTSFPSGHATQAFSVASVVAMRSNGWTIPALAYTAATLVAFDRVNTRAHFPSDVFAGAVLGTFTGRLLVSRHRQEEAGAKSKFVLDIVPMRRGLQARMTFSSGYNRRLCKGGTE